MKIFKSKRSTNAHPARNRKIFGIWMIGVTLLILGGFVLRFSFVATVGEVDSNNLAKQRQKQYQLILSCRLSAAPFSIKLAM